MSAPLSPLTPSRQNSQPFSPGISGLVAREDVVDNMVASNDRLENSFSSPRKMVDDLSADAERRQSYTATQEPNEQDLDYDNTDPILPPSSPFQYDARDDTVDFQMLRSQQLSTTPRKRSYEHVPEDDVLDDRYRKGTARRDMPDISVYTDEDASINNEQSIRESVGLEIGNSLMEEKHHEGMSTVIHENNDNDASNEKEGKSLHENDDMIDDTNDSMDETCLSTFSAVTNVDMTSFAHLRGDSPLKARQALPSSPNQPSFFPRKRYSMQNERYSPSRRSPLRTVRESTRSPAKVSLLDFDLPAAPTPRSIPSVTPRELESLKSGFLSEISSLKATLSGKEAEVASLKQAVADAERRVGETSEEVRNEAARRETLEIEQAEWQRRGQEMEDVLQSVKAEMMEGEREREQLMRRAEEMEKGKEQLESRVVELETQLSSARKPASNDKDASERAQFGKTAEETAKEVQDAVEKVARELHTLYKSKHETKVAALKKSYEARWDKRLREAENKLKSAYEDNERLKVERDAALSEVSQPDLSMITREKDEHEAEKRVLEAQIKGLQQELGALKDDSERLHHELKIERAEKGELVAAVDEWLAIQQNQPSTQDGPQSPRPQADTSPEPTPVEVASEDFRQSISRSSSSSIRPPSTASSNGEKKIPRIPAPGNRQARGNSGGKSGIAVFTPGRSGIMGSIERMGRGGV
ncbi:hypothetical protein ANOM_009228 [Aspergillus nomiae NRRL 13137]|uniref:Kinetoplast-associated protein KAP n=1 Tax=Aspergillus nomiae NRRL (strain ATCC 15546 / NRRL 13137 / CBS 260.88 / M93) TaxID=1509407 RepID=A0A0L1IUJ0_ASPN3|nr:uncharacterized protein ANOM_009228 [Aspergillus nomiae NRRL 13137]KNG83080.1 hypothetical protein ANOM_009228 [Aspergillus nomiae NRRL 13137]